MWRGPASSGPYRGINLVCLLFVFHTVHLDIDVRSADPTACRMQSLLLCSLPADLDTASILPVPATTPGELVQVPERHHTLLLHANFYPLCSCFPCFCRNSYSRSWQPQFRFTLPVARVIVRVSAYYPPCCRHCPDFEWPPGRIPWRAVMPVRWGS